MKKVIVGLLIVVVVAVVAIGMTPQEPINKEPEYVTDPEVKDIIKQVISDEFGGDVQIGNDITYHEICEICKGGECVIYEMPCWKVTITDDNGMPSEASISAPESGPSGQKSDLIDTDPIESECRYFYTDQNPQFNIEVYNDDCNNPLPTCDQSQEKCRRCTNGLDCIRTEKITNVDNYLKTYEYHIIGTFFNGGYVEENSSCTIDDSTIIIYSNITTFEYCRDEIFSHATCEEDGTCFFI